MKKQKKEKIFGDQKVIVYTDGGARGNPGPAAIGVVISFSAATQALLGKSEKEYGEYIGLRTNNQAEYEAVIFALKKIKALIGKKKTKESEIEVRMDSELVARQLGGKYKILEENLQPLFFAIWNLKFDFKNVNFVHVPREENKKADRLVNKVLDSRIY